jgi:peptidoglycan hydrolase FlgJ
MALKIDPAAIPAAHSVAKGGQVAPTPNAHDFRQFAALRRGADANDPATLREVARQFESIFTKMMLSSMRQASFGDPLFGSDQGDMYQDMMDDQLAVQLSQGRGLGLADMLIRQLSQGGVGAAGEAGADTARVTPAQQRKFVDEMLPHATAAARELGVDARAIIAQAALETGWGTSLPAGAGHDAGNSNNVFGIKAGASWHGERVEAATTEFVDGVARGEQARFRAYGSVAENVADYVSVLRQPRYADALGTGSDVRAFATALQHGGYATDPDYANKLVAIVDQVADQLSAPLAARQPDAADVNSFKSETDAPISRPRMNNG